ncbi:FUSC family protein [Streptomyces sulphureus]|uniref:FUSC family protein n=1 Tax=Streptomyces sulphureus TaxID=47758 RepID=UPI000361F108|nr:FUSC family protein [Streptomyces sulphureus]
MNARTSPRPHSVAGTLRKGLREARAATSAAWQRLKSSMWPVVQQTVAATVAWWIAAHFIDHHQPIFAPITTIVALNTTRGGRGTNAVRFVLGVIAGVFAAQLTVAVLGPGYPTVAVAVFLAILAALLFGGVRVTMAQAGVSAIIAVATGTSTGTDRVVDAVLGGAVALVFSQLLFPAHPLAALRRAESAILRNLAHALTLTAEVVEHGDSRGSQWTWEHLLAAYQRLVDLGEARDNADTVARRSPLWWGQRQPIERESAYAARLDLLGNSCLTLTRTATELPPGQRSALSPVVRELSETLRSLAASPGDRAERQRAAERAVAVAARVTGPGSESEQRPEPDSGAGSVRPPAPGPGTRHDSSPVPGPAPAEGVELLVARAGVRMVVFDILVFVGVEGDADEQAGVGARTGAGTGSDEAAERVLSGAADVRVSAPPELRWPAHLPFRLPSNG